MTGTLFIFGYGYSAGALARLLVPHGWTVRGTTRNSDKCDAIRADGVTPVLWPGEAPDLSGVTHLLSTAGPAESGDPVLAALRPEIEALAPSLTWAGYLSTTGVYGDHDGGWVDEETPVAPTSRRGELRAGAEAEWRSIPGLPLHIFRLAGIYGPGRGPFAKVRAGTARRIVKPGQVFSRIHVEDIAQVLAASMAQPRPGAVYNLCDDDPAPPQDVIAHAARLLNLPPPPEQPFEQAEMTPMARSFYSENKRVRNDRIKTELGVKLAYPTYREGLRHLLAVETGNEGV
ncbi:SDR family oxidoreductase [Cribrihabitans sp. XS_ASV171]